MGEEPDSSSDDEAAHRIYHRKIKPDPDEPQLGILYTIAEVEECDVEDLPPLYRYIDHMIENLFDTPPPEKAQVELSFTYYNYRVEMDQQGNVRLMRQAEPLDVE